MVQGSKPGGGGQNFSNPSRPALAFLCIISLFTPNLSDYLPVSLSWFVLVYTYFYTLIRHIYLVIIYEYIKILFFASLTVRLFGVCFESSFPEVWVNEGSRVTVIEIMYLSTRMNPLCLNCNFQTYVSNIAMHSFWAMTYKVQLHNNSSKNIFWKR